MMIILILLLGRYIAVNAWSVIECPYDFQETNRMKKLQLVSYTIMNRILKKNIYSDVPSILF